MGTSRITPVDQLDKEISEILEILCRELRSRFPFLEIRQKNNRMSRNSNNYLLNMFINNLKL